jgi:hypothetical protein
MGMQWRGGTVDDALMRAAQPALMPISDRDSSAGALSLIPLPCLQRSILAAIADHSPSLLSRPSHRPSS